VSERGAEDARGADGSGGEPASPAADPAVCYRHPDREAHIRCVRCERRICPDCMIPASVGFQCPECVKQGSKSVRRATTVFGGRVTDDPGWVSKVIIALNVVAFVLQQVVDGFTARFFDLGAIPPGDPVVGVASGEYYRLLTSAFLHGGVVHLLLNMYALYLFGPPVEAALGRVRFVALYLLSALGGSALSYAFANPLQPSLGASGAVFGLLGAFLVINRRLGRDTSGVMVLLAINFAYGFLVPRIDWRAHLGGLVVGALCAAVFAYAPNDRRRTAVQVAGLVAILLVVLAVIAWRTADLTS
jgi:membrane associated rhomboid family serine protease